jgi:ribosomal-protein-alanine N-acetyltransferase
MGFVTLISKAAQQDTHLNTGIAKNSVIIITDRIILRSLVEADVSERYLGWFSNTNGPKDFIVSAPKMKLLSDLLFYVQERVNRKDVVFLGIFNRDNGLHIGNIKYEPINFELGYAVMGILIGDSEYRGKGIATEALMASAEWLKQKLSIEKILLSVEGDHESAIRAYLKAGFKMEESPFIINSDPAIKTMALHL